MRVTGDGSKLPNLPTIRTCSRTKGCELAPTYPRAPFRWEALGVGPMSLGSSMSGRGFMTAIDAGGRLIFPRSDRKFASEALEERNNEHPPRNFRRVHCILLALSIREPRSRLGYLSRRPTGPGE